LTLATALDALQDRGAKGALDGVRPAPRVRRFAESLMPSSSSDQLEPIISQAREAAIDHDREGRGDG
jgi:hypothetical protein